MSKATKPVRQPARKKTTKSSAAALGTCPVGNAGWCAYPFSVAQLQKRMKRISEGSQSTEQLAVSGHK